MLGALVAKLRVAQSTLLISSLLLVVARLVHLHLPELVRCLAAMPGPTGARAELTCQHRCPLSAKMCIIF